MLQWSRSAVDSSRQGFYSQVWMLVKAAIYQEQNFTCVNPTAVHPSQYCEQYSMQLKIYLFRLADGSAWKLQVKLGQLTEITKQKSLCFPSGPSCIYADSFRVFSSLSHLEQLFWNQECFPPKDRFLWGYVNTAIALGCGTKRADWDRQERAVSARFRSNPGAARWWFESKRSNRRILMITDTWF